MLVYVTTFDREKRDYSYKIYNHWKQVLDKYGVYNGFDPLPFELTDWYLEKFSLVDYILREIKIIITILVGMIIALHVLIILLIVSEDVTCPHLLMNLYYFFLDLNFSEIYVQMENLLSQLDLAPTEFNFEDKKMFIPALVSITRRRLLSKKKLPFHTIVKKTLTSPIKYKDFSAANILSYIFSDIIMSIIGSLIFFIFMALLLGVYEYFSQENWAAIGLIFANVPINDALNHVYSTGTDLAHTAHESIEKILDVALSPTKTVEIIRDIDYFKNFIKINFIVNK